MPAAGDDASKAELLHAEYERYDRCVDIVSAAEVWFTRAAGMKDTVAHFERYPSISAGEILATPDFTVVFDDGTAYVGELSNLSLQQASLDSLCAQIGRYDQLDRVPGPDGSVVQVSAVDVLLFVPHSEANSAVARMSAAIADENHPYSPGRFPSVFAWSFDATNAIRLHPRWRATEPTPPRARTQSVAGELDVVRDELRHDDRSAPALPNDQGFKALHE